MKKTKISALIMSLVVLFSLTHISKAQLPDTWTQKADFGGIERFGAVGFSIGMKGYIGTGCDGDSLFSDFWEYDPIADTWTQKADFGGSARIYAVGFSINSKGYIGTGMDWDLRDDFWEYDPIYNIWSQKASLEGGSRYGAVGFSVNSKGYIGTGSIIYEGEKTNDFWEYDPLSDDWTRKTDFSGLPRNFATGFGIGNKGYLGTGSTIGLVNDFWEYDPENDSWIEKASISNFGRKGGLGYSNGSRGYIGLGEIGGFANDMWEYDPTGDLWIKRDDFVGASRHLGVSFSIGNSGYYGTGFSGTETSDFWVYTPVCISPIIVTQPENQMITYGDSVIFSVSSIESDSFKWQEDSGAGFFDILEGGIYSNVSTPNLTISLPTTSMNGFKYRCVLNGNCPVMVVTSGYATLFMNPLTISINPATGQTKEYGSADPSQFLFTYFPALIGNDELVGQLDRVNGEDAGNYEFTLGSLTVSSNYVLLVTSPPSFIITAKYLTVMADNKSKCYDGSIFNGGYTATITGFISGENENDLVGELMFEGTSISAVDTGGYTIIPSGLTSLNYSIAYENGVLQIIPSPSPLISGLSSICAGSSGIVYTTESSFINYVWTISYGGIITQGLNTNQVTVDWGTAGSRSISVNYENTFGCLSPTPTTYNVSVLSVPVPIIAGEDSICSSTTGVIYTTQINYNNYVWFVSAGGSITSGAGTNSIIVSWIGSGNQTVSVDYVNQEGCQSLSPTVFNVYVGPKPAAAGTVIGASSVCAGTNDEVYSAPPIAYATSYEWTVPTGVNVVSGNGTSSITVNFAVNANSGIIKVYGVNECGNGVSSPNFNVQVNPIPVTPVITQHGDTLISSANTENQWYLDGVAIPGATGKEHIAVYIGIYFVVVTHNDCSSSPSNSILIEPVSIYEIIASSFALYPNPSNGLFNMKFESANNDIYNIEIYNSQGSLVWKQNDVIVDGLYNAKIDLKGSPIGVYTIVLRNKLNSFIKKVVIMK
jgi:hypothetical protein